MAEAIDFKFGTQIEFAKFHHTDGRLGRHPDKCLYDHCSEAYQNVDAYNEGTMIKESLHGEVCIIYSGKKAQCLNLIVSLTFQWRHNTVIE